MIRLLLRTLAVATVVIFLTSWVVLRAFNGPISRSESRVYANAIAVAVGPLRDQLSELDRDEAEELVASLDRPGAPRARVIKWNELPAHQAPQVVPRYWEVVVEVPGKPWAVRIGPVGGSWFPGNLRFRVGVLLLISAACLSVVFVLPLLFRVRRLERAATAFGSGELEARVGDSRRDLLGELGARFDAMADRIAQHVRQQEHLLHALAHEYRSPLGRARFSLDVLADAESDEDRARHGGRIDAALCDLERLVDEVLVYARLEGAPEPELFSPTDAIEAALEGVDVPEHVRVELVAGEEVRVWAHAAQFERVVRNLIENAGRYARTVVRVQVSASPDGVSLEVMDDGPGIPVTDRQRVFEPFTRLDPSRDRETGSVGLGLAMVQRIAQSHGGEASVHETPGGGARMVVTWPLPASS